MNKTEKILSWLTYLIGISLVITEVYSSPMSYMTINLGVLIMMVAWILCMRDVARRDSPQWLWLYLIGFLGGIAIPVYLLTDARKADHIDKSSA